MTIDAKALVTQQLNLAGITPAPNEVEALILGAAQRAKDMDAMYAIPEARYDEPGLIFNPERED